MITDDNSVDIIAGPISEIDHQRFSIGPTDEVVLTWWDHTVTFSVMRENTGHQVLVHEDVDVDWSWHIGISLATVVIVVLGSLIMGLPIVYAAMLGVLLGLIIMGLISYERYISEDNLDQVYRNATKIDGDTVLIMDEPLWEEIKADAQSIYNEGLQRVRDREESGRRAPAWLKKLRPFPSRTMMSVLRNMHQHMEGNALLRSHEILEKHYLSSYDTTVSCGRGVRHCTCRACVVMKHHGWDTDDIIPGQAAAQQRKPHRIALGEGAEADHASAQDKMRKKAQQRVELYEQRRAEEAAAAKEAERKRKAKEYVSDRMGKKPRTHKRKDTASSSDS